MNAPGESAPPKASKSTLWFAVRSFASLVLVVVAYYALPDDLDGASAAMRLVLFCACVVGLGVLIAYLVARGSRSTVPTRAEGLLLTVVLSLVFFASVYYRLAQTSGQFTGLETRTDALYFTLVTTATVGYGDVAALGQTSRIVVMVQIVFNLVFLGTAASVMLDRVKERRQHRGRGGAQ